MKVTNEIGLFTRLSLSLSKMRTEAKSASQPKAASSTNSFISPIKDKIDISAFRSKSDVQSLTSEMTKKSFSSVKEYGAYYLNAYNKNKTDKT